MDFFEAQEQARRRTRRLLVYFALAVLGITVAVYLCLLLVFGVGSADLGHGPTRSWRWWHPQLFGFAAAGTLLVVTLGSLYRITTLRAGGRVVAEALGGRLVRPDTRDLEERRLLNVVEEMALASGLPVPPVYVLDQEPGINAFAAGFGPHDAVIGVTRGCLRLLNRDELQGVIAHEFSHILNGDMRLNLRLIGWIFGIFCLAEVGRVLLRTRGRNNPLPILGLLLIVLGWIGVVFGRLIQAAVSRQREFLADAAAVQFTRNPPGLAGALRKIGGLVYGSRIDNPHAMEAAHLFFSSAFRRSGVEWFATHPPLTERIRRLDPAWDGTFPRVTLEGAGVAAEGVGAGPARQRAGVAAVAAQLAQGAVPGRAVLERVGRPGPRQIQFAGELRAAVPDEVVGAVESVVGAQAVVLGLVLSREETLRHQQLLGLQTRLPTAVYSHLTALVSALESVPQGARLPLVQLALPSLRLMDAESFVQFRQALRWLVVSDRQIDLFEYTLERMIERHLEPHFGRVRPRPVQYYSVNGLLRDAQVLLSALAWSGQADPDRAGRAFLAGWQQLETEKSPPPLLPRAECHLAAVDAALNRCAEASPAVKRRLLAACVEVVGADGWLHAAEAELLRAVADAMDCPVPPLLTEAKPQTRSAI